MRVVVYCEKCTALGEVHLHGGWDIKTVRHDCPVQSGMTAKAQKEARAKPTPIRFEFDPPRSVF